MRAVRDPEPNCHEDEMLAPTLNPTNLAMALGSAMLFATGSIRFIASGAGRSSRTAEGRAPGEQAGAAAAAPESATRATGGYYDPVSGRIVPFGGPAMA